MNLLKTIFYILFGLEILGGILLAAVNLEMIQSQLIPIISFGIFFFVSPFLLTLSIYNFMKDKENLTLPAIGGTVAIAGLTIVVLVFIEISRL